jgi:FkbM family methyltransferase
MALDFVDVDTLERAFRSVHEYRYLGGRLGLVRVIDSVTRLYVHTHELNVAPHLILDGYWESWVTLSMLQRMRPGGLMVDVGANAGWFSAVGMRASAARVVAFEPNPSLAELLRRSVHTNGWSERVQVVESAASDRRGSGMLAFRGDNWGSAWVETDRQASDERIGTRRKIALERIDSVLTEPIGLLKVDAEGHEPEVLRGAEGCIARHVPQLLLEFTASAYEDAGGFLGQLAERWTLGQIEVSAAVTPLDRDRVLQSAITMLWGEPRVRPVG